jgi:hypothetical protein
MPGHALSEMRIFNHLGRLSGTKIASVVEKHHQQNESSQFEIKPGANDVPEDVKFDGTTVVAYRDTER